MANRRDTFLTIRTEGGLLPADLLLRLRAGKGVEGLTPEHYHLSGEKLGEAASRSYSRLRGAWAAFQGALAALPPGDPATTVTRERWLLPLFQELGYGRLLARKALELEGKSYPISHGWESAPIHLLGARVDIDRSQKGVAGAAKQSPYGLVQELLNRSPEHLWGFVSNGRVLRVLRDNLALTRQAYLEFDLEAMMSGEVYPDFVLLWLICHQSRVEIKDGGKPHDCWLERWCQAARARGTRALDGLRDGVEEAIVRLGAGFIRHPRNRALQERLRSGKLDKQDYYRQLLRLVYRLLFLMVAEERGVLFAPGADDAARARYTEYYSVARLRRLAERRGGSAHCDLWRGLRLVLEQLGRAEGCPALGLPALGGFLFSGRATPELDGCDLANEALLDALRALCFTVEDRVRRAVSYADLGAEELGSIYEALLELHPEINLDLGQFSLTTAAGHERKTTGSYYTPASLVMCLLDSALDPVLEVAARQQDPEQAILGLKVCDPACGSGHFLIAAAHRIARRLAAVRTGEDEPPPEAVRTALHDVIGRCIYGVDLNEMAVELCKVSLWMEAMEPGKPLSFLEHHILPGNSLLGATPALLAKGVLDEAFTAIEGDDKKVCTALKKRNKKEREQAGQIGWSVDTAQLGETVLGLDRIGDDVAGQQRKEQEYAALRTSERYQRAKLQADAYCAAFMIRKDEAAVKAGLVITHDTLRQIGAGAEVTEALHEEMERLAAQYQFLHYHLEFPDVFREEEGGGFDVVLGNPPWERVTLQEQEFFGSRDEMIAKAPNAAARKKLIAKLPETNPGLWAAWCAASREAEGQSLFIRGSGRYPLCGKGDVNTYAIFAEHNRAILGPKGRAGFIVPTGIATDNTTKSFFADLIESHSLVSLYSFFEIRRIFIATDSRDSPCLLTLTNVSIPSQKGIDFVFSAHEVSDLAEQSRHFTLTAAEIMLLNPNTRTCPIFRSRRDADLNLTLYHRASILWHENDPSGNPWGLHFMRMLDMANDSGLFRMRGELEQEGMRLLGNAFSGPDRRYLPLIEAKMVHHFDHRFGDYTDQPRDSENTALPAVTVERLRDPGYAPAPRYWVAATKVAECLNPKWSREWLLGWRDICRSTDQRTVIASLIPRVAVGHTTPLMFSDQPPRLIGSLYANLCSFALDYAARQKVGGTHLTYSYLKQLPVIPPDTYTKPAPWSPGQTLVDWILPRVLELTYTAWDLEPFAQDCGYDVPPFRWDSDRRFILRAELDAAFFHLYGISRDDAAYILDTFPIVRRNDEKAHGQYRTKNVILQIYDQLAAAAAAGTPYRTRLPAPPADPSVAHPPGGKLLPFRRVTPAPEERNKTCVPLYPLRAAAGPFADPQAVEHAEWVAPLRQRPLRPGMFVAQVVGNSMEPLVPDGAYALFKGPVDPPYDNRVLLCQHRRIQGPDASYALKRVRRTERPGPDGQPRPALLLQSENPAYAPIELTEQEGAELTLLGELVEVLSTGPA